MDVGRLQNAVQKERHDMGRSFYMFFTEAPSDKVSVVLVEDGIAQAMSTVSKDIFPVNDEADMAIFQMAMAKAFGQPWPPTESKWF